MTKSEALKCMLGYLAYDKNSGNLTWVKAPTSRSDFVGMRAGSKHKDGYRYIMFRRYRFLEHRVIWHFLGFDESPQIDHINGVRNDNRLCNLRPASNAQNSMNKPKQSNNTSGYKGVTFNKTANKFHAKICANGKRHSLGYYKTAPEAYQAYIQAQGELHGQFAKQ